jgi:hypothetical protein
VAGSVTISGSSELRRSARASTNDPDTTAFSRSESALMSNAVSARFCATAATSETAMLTSVSFSS